MPHSLIYPMTAHITLVAILYALLTLFRAPSIWGVGRLADGSNPWSRFESRVSANLSNQFEWPLFFHVACVLLIQRAEGDPLALMFAWSFSGGRVLHSGVQILTANVQLRGLVFTVNFVAVLGLWAIVMLSGGNSWQV